VDFPGAHPGDCLIEQLSQAGTSQFKPQRYLTMLAFRAAQYERSMLCRMAFIENNSVYGRFEACFE
jgi:hypothetical protein